MLTSLISRVIMGMVNSDIWTRLLNTPSDIFECSLYRTHVAGREQEQSSTNSTLYTMYRVLDMKDGLFYLGLDIAPLSPTDRFLLTHPQTEAAYHQIPAKGDIPPKSSSTCCRKSLCKTCLWSSSSNKKNSSCISNQIGGSG